MKYDKITKLLADGTLEDRLLAVELIKAADWSCAKLIQELRKISKTEWKIGKYDDRVRFIFQNIIGTKHILVMVGHEGTARIRATRQRIGFFNYWQAGIITLKK